jgi:hypothetical protein
VRQLGQDYSDRTQEKACHDFWHLLGGIIASEVNEIFGAADDDPSKSTQRTWLPLGKNRLVCLLTNGHDKAPEMI